MGNKNLIEDESEYMNILNNEDTEENNINISNSKNSVDEIKDKYALVIGQIQIGKSTFINCITKSGKCKIGNGIVSCTKKIDSDFPSINEDGFNFYFVDTPGLNDGKGDKENINQLERIKKIIRPNVIILSLNFQHAAITNSFKKALEEFMNVYPSEKFWDQVLILFTHSQRQAYNFIDTKNNINQYFVNEINEDKDLCKFMEIKNIKKPYSDRIKQFFVECTNDISILDEDTKKEFINILNAIKDIYPIYKEMDDKPKYDVKEIEKDGEKFLRLKTVMQITFTDFDDTKHSTEPVELPEETYPISDDLIGKQPIDVIVKREQTDEPRSRFWPCCKDQYRTKY